MSVTARELNRATLERQLLLRRADLDVHAAVRRLVALQAQHPASPYLALWARLADFDPAQLDAAFAARTVVRATLMRVTLQAVDASDYATFHQAMQPTLRAARLGDRRFTAAGIAVDDLDAAVPDLLRHAETPRTAKELEDWLAGRLGPTARPGALWATRSFAPLWRTPGPEPWSFGTKVSYVASGARTLPRDADAARAALREVVRRYLVAFGPASVADVSQFTLVQRSSVRAVLDELGDGVEQLVGPAGSVLFDVPGSPRPAPDTEAPPRLLPMWDNVLLAYADRSRVIPSDYRRLVTRNNGDVLPTLLVDGYVAGVWRPLDGRIEATAFHALPEDVWASLAGEARALLELVADREPGVYGRYGHWWSTVPVGETRLLP
ncbi:conserved hypothetical protein [Beutenbergia cavernae DSM 12333]|uniref:Winged helix DNA-binding domain-containing protein n=1 Tax=Beutenbergia cavernae (strain ATCC BAA-8 / DSM 12333 / CCUG 43141 / JCM 11478 / NBRC 16432 / NCIMB 13614 / HKI 0122) TaxID=471853 RepID=C5C6B6_BEUC1|nr:winged helix DNA-binding domain-containing protein [Beutenbergia cavernae]ACQ80322.1 conserved hypothetical protein [Beutenbergia cavernae DSM 12333]